MQNTHVNDAAEHLPVEAPPAAGSPPPAVEAQVAVEVPAVVLPTVDAPPVVMEPPPG